MTSTSHKTALSVNLNKVALVRKQRAQQAAAQQQAETMQQAAATAKDLSQANTQQPSALTNVMGMFSGYQ